MLGCLLDGLLGDIERLVTTDAVELCLQLTQKRLDATRMVPDRELAHESCACTTVFGLSFNDRGEPESLVCCGLRNGAIALPGSVGGATRPLPPAPSPVRLTPSVSESLSS